MIDKNETIAAVATPPGKGGIGIIRMSGPQSLSIASSICGESPTSRIAKYCSFKDASGKILDKGIVLFFPGPASYTGEDVIELQGHGGQVVLNSTLEQTLQLGARLARPGEFTERAFHNNKLDLLQAEAVADLIDSASSEAANSALRSLNGEFSSRIENLLHELIAIRVLVEGALDFPEEEIDIINTSDLSKKIEKSLESIDSIISQARNGQVLKEGINVAIIGAPNVGKSSLLNVLSQTNKAIVASSPGTTRDIVEEKILIGGMPLHIVDTAGIRKTKDSVEQEGIERAKKAIDKADLVLLVREATPSAELAECQISHLVPQEKPGIVIYNKIDLLDKPTLGNRPESDRPVVFLSAKTEEGLEGLKDKIKQLMGIANPGEIVLPGRTRHIHALEKASAALVKATNELKSKKPALELMAADLQLAQQCIETITGKSTPDDLLGEIFSSFCIGK